METWGRVASSGRTERPRDCGRACALALLFAGVSLLPALAAGDDAAERDRLVGTWQGWVVEGKGERPDQNRVRIEELVITRDRITAKDARMSLGEGSFRLDIGQNPHTIDASGTGGQANGKTYLGIYALEGNTLKWCSGNPGRPRPAEFASRQGGGQFLMTLHRR